MTNQLAQEVVEARLDKITERFVEMIDLLERADCGPLMVATHVLWLSSNVAVSRMGCDWAAKLLREHADRIATEYDAP